MVGFFFTCGNIAFKFVDELENRAEWEITDDSTKLVFYFLFYFYLTTSPDGIWIVLGAALPMNLFTSRILANVPRDITASFPRREPYELNSRDVNLKTRRRTSWGKSMQCDTIAVITVVFKCTPTLWKPNILRQDCYGKCSQPEKCDLSWQSRPNTTELWRPWCLLLWEGLFPWNINDTKTSGL